MGRPKKCRLVSGSPAFAMYKPAGAPLRSLTGAVLPVEGLEALRLVDAEGLDQEEAAGRMGVSRPTLNRILGQARAVVARALANGWALRVEGGAWALAGEPEAVEQPGEPAAGMPPCGRGRGRCGRGPGGPHRRGVR